MKVVKLSILKILILAIVTAQEPTHSWGVCGTILPRRMFVLLHMCSSPNTLFLVAAGAAIKKCLNFHANAS